MNNIIARVLGLRFRVFPEKLAELASKVALQLSPWETITKYRQEHLCVSFPEAACWLAHSDDHVFWFITPPSSACCQFMWDGTWAYETASSKRMPALEA
jgi:hypothetical protein